jgi:hypothetical protein
MSASVLKGVVRLAAACVLSSCGGGSTLDRDVFVVASDTVPIFATRDQSLQPPSGNSLAVLQPGQSVLVVECIDLKQYQIYKVRLPDGRTGFVNAGHYTLRARSGTPTPCAD